MTVVDAGRCPHRVGVLCWACEGAMRGKEAKKQEREGKRQMPDRASAGPGRWESVCLSVHGQAGRRLISALRDAGARALFSRRWARSNARVRARVGCSFPDVRTDGACGWARARARAGCCQVVEAGGGLVRDCAPRDATGQARGAPDAACVTRAGVRDARDACGWRAREGLACARGRIEGGEVWGHGK